jgi:hypothetical protein
MKRYTIWDGPFSARVPVGVTPTVIYTKAKWPRGAVAYAFGKVYRATHYRKRKTVFTRVVISEL